MRIRHAIASLLIMLSSAAWAEKPPKIQYDPYTKTETITGDDHSHMSILDEGFSGYAFAASAVNGVMRNPVLTYSIDASDWYFINSAADIDGNQLSVIQGGRDVDSNASIHENFGVELTPEYLRSHRSTGMNIKLMGSRGEKIIKVRPEAVSAFDDVYERELAKFGGIARSPTMPTFPSAGAAGSASALLGTNAIFGILYAQTPMGTVVANVVPGTRAERAGLKQYQIITAVDGQSVIGLSTADVGAKLKALGPDGKLSMYGGGTITVP